MTHEVEDGDHNEDKGTDDDIYYQLACNFLVELTVTKHHHHMPVVGYSVNENRTFISVDSVLEASGSGFLQGI